MVDVYCGAWTWGLNFFHEFFAYDFGGEESRPSDLQAWIVESGIPGERGRDWEVISASRMSNSISRDREEFGSAHRELGHEERLLIFA